ncbi:ribosome modulation factor [Atopomonas hussainii]|uniref:Ribosome modulation factor n=1 Tax=Atopomonas hussainii TaxID=1429083 RepID=A0A1H7GWV4_9GAMM|nr:ribosome modulation factor [Atopomonas hussainii]SEK42514.1 ribosome modulation factor [Atopomonas hussainii]
MKRLKRDPQERAFVRGYQNGLQGKSKELCPFDQGTNRQAWMNGWREGRSDNWDGLAGASAVHRLNAVHAVG